MLVVALPLLCSAAIQELRAPADALRQGLLFDARCWLAGPLGAHVS
jgi:hypothetical protein